MTETPSTRTSYRHGETLTELTLTLPTALLERLVWVADNAATAYSDGGDDEDELLFADAVLRPLATLLAQAEQTQ